MKHSAKDGSAAKRARRSTEKPPPELQPPQSAVIELQRAAGNHSVAAMLERGGQPLGPTTRSEMEVSFGHTFHDVRIHTDAAGDSAARDHSARAVTIGSDVAFRAGEYQPETPAGRRLIAHELAHVIQQQRGGNTPTPPSAGGDSGLEGDARAAADAVTVGAPVSVTGASAPGVAADPLKDDDNKPTPSPSTAAAASQSTPSQPAAAPADPKMEGLVAQRAAYIAEMEAVKKELGSVGGRIGQLNGQTKTLKGDALTNATRALADARAERDILDRRFRQLSTQKDLVHKQIEAINAAAQRSPQQTGIAFEAESIASHGMPKNTTAHPTSFRDTTSPSGNRIPDHMPKSDGKGGWVTAETPAQAEFIADSKVLGTKIKLTPQIQGFIEMAKVTKQRVMLFLTPPGAVIDPSIQEFADKHGVQVRQMTRALVPPSVTPPAAQGAGAAQTSVAPAAAPKEDAPPSTRTRVATDAPSSTKTPSTDPPASTRTRIGPTTRVSDDVPDSVSSPRASDSEGELKADAPKRMQATAPQPSKAAAPPVKTPTPVATVPAPTTKPPTTTAPVTSPATKAPAATAPVTPPIANAPATTPTVAAPTKAPAPTSVAAPKTDATKLAPSATKIGNVDTKAPGGTMGQIGSAIKTAAVAAALDFANNMLKEYIADLEVERQIEARFAKLQPAVDRMLATNPKQVHAAIHIHKWYTTQDKISSAGVEEKRGFTMVTVSVEVTDHAIPTANTSRHEDLFMGAIDFTDIDYSVLIIDVEKELEKQRIAHDEATLKERIRVFAKANEGRQQPKAEKVEPPPRVVPGSTTLLPPAPPPPRPLLPGAPPPTVNEEEFAAYARNFGNGLLAEGVRLRNTSAPEAQRNSFMLKVQIWRGQMRKLIRDFGNYKTKESLTTTLLSFDDKMRELGSQLGIDKWKDE